MSDSLHYTVDAAAPGHVIDRLSGLFRLGPEAGSADERTFFDTFDWRLYGAGYLLWSEGRGRGRRLMLADRDTRRVVAGGLRPSKLVFSDDLPLERMRATLAPVMEMRALLPVATVEITRTRYPLLDDNAKTVARLEIDHYRVSTDGGTVVNLPLEVVLNAVRGYEDCLEEAQATLSELSEMQPSHRDLLSLALAARGRRPMEYSSKLDISLEPGMRADMAAVRIHRHLLDTLEANMEGTLNDVDSEFLHDLRVAVRRTRSALSQIKGVFEPEVAQRFAPEFGWLGSVTGPTRDLDVFLLEFDKYRDSLPAAQRGDLAPFHEFLIRHQRKAQRALRRHLRGERCTGLLAGWRAFLEQPLPAVVPLAPNGIRPVEEVASARIWRMYRRVLREGRAIGPDSPAEDLHELRKSCKKLRYLIEFFQSLYPEAPIKALVKTLKKLLDNLGEFQDLEVHADHLRDFTGQMMREDEVPLDTLLAMGGLVTGLLQRQGRARDDFAHRFSQFDTAENRATYKALFKQHPEETAS